MGELTKLGRYELHRVLGKGAMGVVYEGFDPTLGRRVAVKTILKSAALDEETERAYSERFVREAKAVGRLNHSNIVQVHDFGEENEVAYLVMEFIQGRELRSYFEGNERFEIAETVRIMGELLDALEFAHEAGVVHRDVKPANVMLDAQRRIKLTDFGVARVQDGAQQSQAGTMVGTPAFMSPEQISGGKIDRRTDIFSAGTILYQLLTGEQPFKGDGAWTVAKKIMQDEPPQPSSLVTNVSPAYDAIVAKSLAKTPARRYASAKEFAAELRGALRGNAPALAMAMPKAAAKPEARASDTELEFWRSIQNRDDLDELELYVDQFPDGAYSQLARLKIAKLRQTTVHLEADVAAQAKRQAEEQARAQAEERARLEAQEIERQAAEARALREAAEKAEREAAEKARQELEVKARREAEAIARREAAEKAMREAAAKAKREAEEKARQAQALARLKEEQAAARVKARVDDDATVAIGSDHQPGAPAPLPAAARRTSLVVPAVAVIALLAVGIGAFVFMSRKPAPAPVAETPVSPTAQAPVAAAPPKAEVSAADIEKVRKETEERIRREYADKSAAEQATAAKAAADKAVQEKQLAAKAAAEKAAQDKIAADKASAEKASAEMTLAARASMERAAAEQAAAEKAVAEKAAAEKLAAEKAAAAKAATAKPGWPNVGDRWVYEVNQGPPNVRYQATVEVLAVSATSVQEVFRPASGAPVTSTFGAGVRMVGIVPGIAMFAPYMRAFHEIRGGESWSVREYQRLGPCMHLEDCSGTAVIKGKERVAVRAGTFEAWRVEVSIRGAVANISSAGARSTADYTYWYSEDVKRIVKYQIRGAVFWSEPNGSMELLSYTPAGPK
jgi:tRNA A-37 threonylcarbamoyl transferase component Bud32